MFNDILFYIRKCYIFKINLSVFEIEHILAFMKVILNSNIFKMTIPKLNIHVQKLKDYLLIILKINYLKIINSLIVMCLFYIRINIKAWSFF